MGLPLQGTKNKRKERYAFFTSEMMISMPGFTIINPSLLLVSIIIT